MKLFRRIMGFLVHAPLLGQAALSFASIGKGRVLCSSDWSNYKTMLHDFHPDLGDSSLAHNSISLSPEYDLRIIIPCYNVEKYIKMCLDSVLGQETDFKIEVFIVDDGSTDKTADVIEPYLKHANIRFVEQKNGGLSAARNAGLKNINSKYVMFLDSDDFLCDNKVVDGLLRAAEKLSANDCTVIVQCNYVKSFDGRGAKNRPIKNGACKSEAFYGMAWGKVFSSSLFRSVRFPRGYWFEDTVNPMILYQMADRFGSLNLYGYNYTSRVDSISHSAFGLPKSLDALYVFRRLLDDAFTLGINIHSRKYVTRLMKIIILIYLWTRKLSDSLQIAIFFEIAYLLDKYGIPTRVAAQFSVLRSALTKKDFGKYCFNCRLLSELNSNA